MKESTARARIARYRRAVALVAEGDKDLEPLWRAKRNAESIPGWLGLDEQVDAITRTIGDALAAGSEVRLARYAAETERLAREARTASCETDWMKR